MRRREFIAGLSGAAVAWSLPARAQQPGRLRRVGVLMYVADDDPLRQARLAALTEELQQLGWIKDRNLQIDLRFDDRPTVIAEYAAALVNRAPEVIVAYTAVATRALKQRTQTIPIIFAGTGDPVIGGLVESIAHPEGNTTGFVGPFSSFGGKWLGLLKEAVPRVTRVAAVYNTESSSAATFEAYFSSIEAAAAQLAIKTVRTPVRNHSEIERALAAFATEPNGGLIVLPPPFANADRELIVKLAATHQLPAMYQLKVYATVGGLMSYGPDTNDLFRRAASYVDRILRGAKVSELPVQFPTKFEMVINLKTARSLGIEIPPAVLVRADEVIE
jgi:putative tryptophan/tyrosine transport system substrate-binding protein